MSCGNPRVCYAYTTQSCPIMHDACCAEAIPGIQKLIPMMIFPCCDAERVDLRRKTRRGSAGVGDVPTNRFLNYV